jgi:hypothetical protein
MPVSPICAQPKASTDKGETARPEVTTALRHGAAKGPRTRECGAPTAETYPGDVYDYVGAKQLSVAVDGKRGKRNQGSRAACAKGVMRKAADAGIELLPDLIDELRDGFGSGSDGEVDIGAAGGSGATLQRELNAAIVAGPLPIQGGDRRRRNGASPPVLVQEALESRLGDLGMRDAESRPRWFSEST